MPDYNVAEQLNHIDKRLNSMESFYVEARDVMINNAVLTERLINTVEHLNKTNVKLEALDKKVTTNREQIVRWCGSLATVFGVVTFIGSTFIIKFLGS